MERLESAEEITLAGYVNDLFSSHTLDLRSLRALRAHILRTTIRFMKLFVFI